MKVQITSKNYVVSNKLKDIIEKKIEKMDRFFSDDADVRVFCKKENGVCQLELTIKDKGMLFRSEVKSDNMYQNIDMVLPKVEKQIIKYSSKLRDKMQKRAILEKDWLFHDENEVEEVAPKKLAVSKIKKFDIVPLDVEDAQMFLENSDHEFYIYLNPETGKVNIIYRRGAGDFGVIEPNY